MKPMIVAIGLGLLLGAGKAAAQEPAPSAGTALDIPRNMSQYFVAFLVKVPGREVTELAPDLARRHLAYIRAMIEQKRYALAGPFLDHDRFAGMAIVIAATLEEAQRIATGDPTVMEGVFAVEIHPAMLPTLTGVTVEY